LEVDTLTRKIVQIHELTRDFDDLTLHIAEET